MRAAKEIHRRWDHMPVGEMKALFKRANLGNALVEEIPAIIGGCPVCKMWEGLPPRQVARSSLAERFNEKVWLDLLFVTIFCEEEPRDCVNLHMLDEASSICLLPLLANRSFSAIRLGILRWTEPWGFMEAVIADGEKGIGSESMKVWLEENHSQLLPIPPAEGSRHSQFGIIDNHSKAVRGAVHRVDASLVTRKVKATAE